MKERLIAGGFAGLVGAAVQGIFDSLAKGLGMTDRVFIDFSQALFSQGLFETAGAGRYRHVLAPILAAW